MNQEIIRAVETNLLFVLEKTLGDVVLVREQGTKTITVVSKQEFDKTFSYA